MKVLLVNGSPHKEGCTYTALKEVADTLNYEGVETDFFWIGRHVQKIISASLTIESMNFWTWQETMTALFSVLPSIGAVLPVQ